MGDSAARWSDSKKWRMGLLSALIILALTTALKVFWDGVARTQNSSLATSGESGVPAERREQSDSPTANPPGFSQDEVQRPGPMAPEAPKRDDPPREQAKTSEDNNKRDLVAPSVPAESDQKEEIGRERSRYVSNQCNGTPARAVIVVLDGTLDSSLSGLVARRLKGRDDCFLQAFVSDGLFEHVLNGDVAGLMSLRIDDVIREVLLIKITSEERNTMPAGQDVKRVDVIILARIIQATAGYSSTMVSARAWGVGFTSAAARQQALARGLDSSLTQLPTQPDYEGPR